MNRYTNIIKKYLTIGVAGCQERIGTTTQSLQVLQYLQLMGYKVCYVEMNASGYIDKMQIVYSNVEYNAKDGTYKIYDIEMFKGDSLPQIIRCDYDYIIKDYGSVKADFNKLSYLESDIKIMVAGGKPNEVFEVQDVIRDKAFDDVRYIFSYLPKDDREGILEMMDDRADKTFFAALNMVDPFIYNSSSNATFKDILT